MILGGVSPPRGNDVMVDLETLGKKAGCVIVSIGLVRFNTRAGVQSTEELLKDSLKIVIDIPASMERGYGFEADGSTIKWWLNQSKEAQNATFNSQHGVRPQEAIHVIGNFFSAENRVWGNGANFDIPILEEYFDRCNRSYPWGYTKVRCFRTIKALLGFDEDTVPDNQIKHDCLMDAVYQAQVLQAIFAANPNIKAGN